MTVVKEILIPVRAVQIRGPQCVDEGSHYQSMS